MSFDTNIWETGVNNEGNGTDNNQYYIFDSVNRLTIQRGTGNIGVGTDAPSQLLDVSGNISLSGNIYLSNTGTIYKNGQEYAGGSGGGSSTVWEENGTKIYYNLGNVGINTNNPGETLEVNGNIKATNIEAAGANITSINATNITSGTLDNARLPANISITGDMTAKNLNVTGVTTTINTDSYQTENLEIISTGADGPSLKITHDTVSHDILQVTDTSSTQSLTMSHDGKIGIGTNSPSAQLHVYDTSSTSDVLKASNTEITINRSIIPESNDTVDIGSAERKIRDMYISDNSLWIGDDHKLAITSDGTMKFRKRNKAVLPKVLSDALGTDAAAIAHANQTYGTSFTDISQLKLNHILSYARTFNPAYKTSDIFGDDTQDYELDTAADAWQINNSKIFLGGDYTNIGIGTNDPDAAFKLDVAGNVNTSGTISADDITIKGSAESGSGAIKLNCEANSHGVSIKGPPHSANQSYTLTLPSTAPEASKVLSTDASGNLSWVDPGSSSASSIQNITTTASKVTIDTELDVTNNVTVKGSVASGSGNIKLNCENNSHGVSIKGPPHSANQSYTLTLPSTAPEASKVLSTDASGNLSWVEKENGQFYLNKQEPQITSGPVAQIESDFVSGSDIYKYKVFKYDATNDNGSNQTEYTLSFTEDTTIDLLIVGGGGSGSNDVGGGGGGGGVILAKSILLNHNNNYSIKVGKGGNGVAGGIDNGNNGFNSEFEGIAALGGGGGRGWQAEVGNDGGSGGGGGANNSSSPNTNGSSIQSKDKTTYGILYTLTNNGEGLNIYGEDGGDGGINTTSTDFYDALAGGGGGANQVGFAGISANGANAGKGGDGIDVSYIFGNSVGENGYFAGGGGGSSDGDMPTGLPGLGGGGQGYGQSSIPNIDGQANTGGGGGGAFRSSISGAGGSGVVIIKYLAKTLSQDIDTTLASKVGENIEWDTDNKQFTLSSNVTITSNLTVYNDINFIGNLYQNGTAFVSGSGSSYYINKQEPQITSGPVAQIESDFVSGSDIYKYKVFKYDATNDNGSNQTEYIINFIENTKADILIVAGGGGGGGTPHGAGGGAGGIILLENIEINSSTSYNVIVGKGGDGGAGTGTVANSYLETDTTLRGKNGANSYFNSYEAIGGGGGGRYSQLDGLDGGSGGGSEDSSSGVGSGLQPSSTYGGFGNSGAIGVDNYKSGGGGGAGGLGLASGEGGEGKYFENFSMKGSPSGWYGGGGGGSHFQSGTRLIGGKGGGGDGGAETNNLGAGLNGENETGGGGGGAERTGTRTGGNGGSGVVIIRYLAKTLSQDIDTTLATKAGENIEWDTNNKQFTLTSNVAITSNLTINNNVGIGTNSPSAQLHVYDTSGASDVLKASNTEITINKSIIPESNNTVDIGSAERKIRDMYISDNSLWIGDDHKLAITSDGTMKFRKRNKAVLPKVLSDASGTNVDAIAHVNQAYGTSFTDISQLKLNHVLSYAKTFNPAYKTSDIFGDDTQDYELDTAADAWQINNLKIFLNDNYTKVGIGTNDPYCLLQVGNLGAGNNSYSETYYNRIAFPSHAHNNNRFLIANRDPNDSTACLDLHYVHDNASLNKHLITMNNSGNVGIGLNNPEYKLHVNGTISCGLNTQWGEPIWQRKQSTVDYQAFGMSLGTSGTNNIEEALCIQRTGRVGIGTNNPHAALHINSDTTNHGGNITSFQITSITGGGWSMNMDPGSGNNKNLYWYAVSIPGNWHRVLAFENDLASRGTSGIFAFTGQHPVIIENVDNIDNKIGLIVSANINDYLGFKDNNLCRGKNAININDSLPIVSITNKNKDKSCFGVISYKESSEKRENISGRLISYYDKDEGDDRIYINSVGEGAIWVSNKNGNLESGDYITSSDLIGYGEKQNDDILHNYTVAKITMNCDFNPLLQYKKIIKKKTIIKSIYRCEIPESELSNIDNDVYKYYFNENDNKYYYDISPDDYNNLTIIEEEWNINNKNIYTEITIETEVNDLLNNTIQWIDSDEQEYQYNIRYLDENSNIITEEEYNTLISNNNIAWKAAFVGCTYHCG